MTISTTLSSFLRRYNSTSQRPALYLSTVVSPRAQSLDHGCQPWVRAATTFCYGTLNMAHCHPSSLRYIHSSAHYHAKSITNDVYVTMESNGSSNIATDEFLSSSESNSNNNDTSCSRGVTSDDVEDEDEQEEMFVIADPVLGLGNKREWGGPRRGGSMPEPTRFGDWERKGRCTDF